MGQHREELILASIGLPEPQLRPPQFRDVDGLAADQHPGRPDRGTFDEELSGRAVAPQARLDRLQGPACRGDAPDVLDGTVGRAPAGRCQRDLPTRSPSGSLNMR